MFTFILIMSIVIGLGCLAVPVTIAVRGLLDLPRVRVLVHTRMERVAAAYHAETGRERTRW
ncbi:hypothetical protein ACIBG7_40350 [Nonomuraea sp. NPDC050328]|uniref:hypothetical protein n=1 Tax=Nonomuraea sp. NPDC050328 TaxID=3364361 RepID=UPI0037A47BCC